MSNIIEFPRKNIKDATTEQLKKEWDLWFEQDDENMEGHDFHYDQIHLELNRRGEGRHCAV